MSHVPSPERGLSVQGQPLPNLPGSVRAVFASKREGPTPPIRTDIDPRRDDALGRRGNADAALYGGQGCRAIVIVSLSDLGFARLNDHEERNAPAFVIALGSPSDPGLVCAAVVVLGLVTWAMPLGARPRSKPGGRRARRPLPSAIGKGS